MSSRHTKILKWLRFATIFHAQLFAFLPFSMDPNTFALKRWFLHRIPPLITIGLFFVSMFNSFQVRTQLFHSDVTNTVVFAMGILYTLNFLVSTMHHYVELDNIERVFVRGHRLYGRLIEANVQPQSAYGRLLVLFAIKGFGLHILYTWFLRSRMQFEYNFIGQSSVMITSIVHSIVPSLFYAAMLWCYYLLGEINASLRRIVAGTLLVDQQIKPFRSQRRFCELSDQLDAVAICHLELCQFIQSLERVVNIPLTLWIAFRCVCVLLEVFSTYMYVSGWLLRPHLGCPLRLMVVAITGGALYAIELAMIANVCLATREEVELDLHILF